MNHLTTFSPVDLGLQFPKELYTSGYSPLVQKFHCQFLKDWAVFLQNTVHILSKWLVDYNGKWYVILLFILMLYYVLGFNQFH